MVTAERRDRCPKCGINWTILREMLQAPYGSDDWETARHIVKNCKTCAEEMGE